MAKKSSKILMGCGIGCGVIILILIALGVSGYMFVKDKFKDFEAVESLNKELTAKYGSVKRFTPDEKTISDEKIEVFLRIREAVSETAANLEEKSDTISDKITEMEEKDESSFSDVFSLIKQGVGSFPKIAEYLKIRNQTLLDNQMGLGEYYYLYTTIYFSYMKKNPQDGPPFPITQHNNDSGPVHIRVNKSDERRDGLRYRGVIMTTYIQDMMIPMLSRFLANGISDPELAEAIKKEIDLLKQESARIPWKDGLPSQWAPIFDKYKTRFEKTYYKTTNPIELGQTSKHRRK